MRETPYINRRWDAYMTDGHGEEYRRVPSDDATSDYLTACLHAPLYGRAHISYAVGKLVAPPRRIIPCVIALIYYRARRDGDNAPSINILRNNFCLYHASCVALPNRPTNSRLEENKIL